MGCCFGVFCAIVVLVVAACVGFALWRLLVCSLGLLGFGVSVFWFLWWLWPVVLGLYT